MQRTWIQSTVPVDQHALAARWSVPPLVALLLANRGLSDDHDAAGFLTPQLRNLHPPDTLPGAVQAAERIVGFIRAKAPIVLYGDYDVDGTTGVAILWHVLQHAGAKVSFYVPHRIEEGYGLNIEAVKRLIEDGAKCIVSVDCGVTACDVADHVRAAGVSLIITDHHAAHDRLPDADGLVHPGLGAGYPNPDLCGAGVAFKLAWEIARQLSSGDRVSPEFRQLLMELLPLAALGTIADVVSLTGENRVIARHGLAGLSDTKLPGLKALIESAGLHPGRINGYDVGFKLAPRINAAGRMGHARLAVELMTKADENRARAPKLPVGLGLLRKIRGLQVVERLKHAWNPCGKDG